MRLFALLAGLALAGLPQLVEAGGCGYSAASYSTYTPVYQSYAPAQEYKQKEVYVASYVPVPVLVPTYSVTLAPAAAYSSTTTTTTTQAAQQTTAATAATAQVQQTTATATVTAEQITALTAAITALQQQVASNQPAAIAAPVKTPLEQCQDELRRAQMELQRLKAVPRQMPKGDEQSRLAPEHVRILSAKCAACHDARTADEKGKGFILLDGASLAFLDAKALGKIAVKIGSGKMPPRASGQEMSDQERAVVLAWLDTAAR